MATTSYIDATFQVRGIGSRTDNVGAAIVGDISAEELRLPDPGLYTEGALSDAAFLVAAGSGMDTTLGSGTSKADRFVVAGEVTGQGSYTVALAQTSVTVTVPAADASARVDEVYLVVLDAPYDSNTLGTASAPVSLPRIGYRKGTAGGGNPGPDTLWKASALIGRIAVGGSVTSIAAADITDARTFALADGANPPGTILDFAGTSVPAGYLACDGSSLLRATYRRLFAAIGTAHGAADGTHFNVPDHRGRLAVGVKASDADFDTVGETGGAKTKTIATGNLPAHTHSTGTLAVAAAGGHDHGIAMVFRNVASAGSPNPGCPTPIDYGAGAADVEPDTEAVADHTHSLSGETGSVGSGTALDIMPPTIVVTKIIRT